MKYIPISELPLLILLVLTRALILRRQGIKALVFGATDKSDFVLVPFIVCFFYGIASSVFNFPFPAFLENLFFETAATLVAAIVLCTASLVWFAVTLKIFGKSFRVGIDEKTNDALITGGTFSLSRNPIYLAFITFFIGIFLAYPSVVAAVFLILLAVTIHRQILREEEFLKKHYGQEYENYCRKTRRYL